MKRKIIVKEQKVHQNYQNPRITKLALIVKLIDLFRKKEKTTFFFFTFIFFLFKKSKIKCL